MACELAFSLDKKEAEPFTDGQGRKRRDPDRAWLETIVSRDTPCADIGTEHVSGYEIDLQAGSCFRELAV